MIDTNLQLLLYIRDKEDSYFEVIFLYFRNYRKSLYTSLNEEGKSSWKISTINLKIFAFFPLVKKFSAFFLSLRRWNQVNRSEEYHFSDVVRCRCLSAFRWICGYGCCLFTANVAGVAWMLMSLSIISMQNVFVVGGGTAVADVLYCLLLPFPLICWTGGNK